MTMTYPPAPASPNVARFLETEDLSILEKPLDFGMSEDFVSFCRWRGAWVGAHIVPLLFHPVLCLNGGSLAKHFSLKLTRDSLVLTSARNDLALHIAEKQVVIPLSEVQDVELVESAWLSRFGLKQLNVWTAAGAGRTRGGRHNRAPEADITAVFLPDPDQAFAAIQLAVRLHKQEQQRAALNAAVAAANAASAAGLNCYTLAYPAAVQVPPGIAVA